MESTAARRRVAVPEPVEADPAGAGPDPDDGFEAFYPAYVDRVHRALTLSLGDDDLAREATDEAMLRAYARWGRVRRLDNPAGWVYRVGLNWATSWWRKLRRERPAVTDDQHPGTPGVDPTALAARAALNRLPLTQRTVVVCRVLLDLSTAETAAVLDLPTGTVKSRLARALETLRAELRDEE